MKLCREALSETYKSLWQEKRLPDKSGSLLIFKETFQIAFLFVIPKSISDI